MFSQTFTAFFSHCRSGSPDSLDCSDCYEARIGLCPALPCSFSCHPSSDLDFLRGVVHDLPPDRSGSHSADADSSRACHRLCPCCLQTCPCSYRGCKASQSFCLLRPSIQRACHAACRSCGLPACRFACRCPHEGCGCRDSRHSQAHGRRSRRIDAGSRNFYPSEILCEPLWSLLALQTSGCRVGPPVCHVGW